MRRNRNRKPGSVQAALRPRAWKSQVRVRIRIAASIALAQLTLPPYGFASIHSSSASRTVSACPSSASSRYACAAGSSHWRREISQGTFTSLGRSSCAYSMSRHQAGDQRVRVLTSVCQSAGRPSTNGPVPRRSSCRAAARSAAARTRSASPGATRSSSSGGTSANKKGRASRRCQHDSSVSSPRLRRRERSSRPRARAGPRRRSVQTVVSAQARRRTTRGGFVSALRASSSVRGLTGS